MKSIAAYKLFQADNNYIVQELSFPKPVSSINDISHFIPAGAYTTFRTFAHSKILPIQAHINRLKESAHLAGKEVIIDGEKLCAHLSEFLKTYPEADTRIRITLDLEKEIGTLYIAFEPLIIPATNDYTQGVQVITRRLKRQNPLAKLTNHITVAEKIHDEMRQGVNEALMVNENGFILEGLSSNFFFIRNNCLYTADEGVLHGIIRDIALNCARKNNISIGFSLLNENEIHTIDEAFITSASRGVLPVVKIDKTIIGNGLPGKITAILMQQYQLDLEQILVSLE